MRTFIALELPAEIKNTLILLQEQLKKCNADLKWVKPVNIHLTLKFLGEIDASLLDPVTAILKEVAQDTPAFSVRLSSVGAFPNLHYPKVIWAGLHQGGQETQAIATELEQRLEKIGIPRETKAFSSHITLARVHSNLRKEGLAETIQNLTKDLSLSLPQETCKISKIILFRSTLTPQGPLYEALATVNLTTT